VPPIGVAKDRDADAEHEETTVSRTSPVRVPSGKQGDADGWRRPTGHELEEAQGGCEQPCSCDREHEQHETGSKRT